jgi:hypothetical protein
MTLVARYVHMKSAPQPSVTTRRTQYDYDRIIRTSEQGLAELVEIPAGRTVDGVASGISQALRARGYQPHTRRTHGPYLLVWVERQPGLRAVRRKRGAA